MKILIWIIVALVVVGGLAWFLSSDSSTNTDNTDSNFNKNQVPSGQVTESGSIESDDQVFEEIDNALSELE